VRRALLALGATLAALGHAPAQPLQEAERKGDWPMFGGRPDRNAVSDEKGLPTEWSWEPRKNVKWVAELGDHTFGSPVVANGRVYIGTNNGKPRDPEVKGDRGILMCFSAADGKFLWQAVHEKLFPNDSEKTHAYDFTGIGVCSTPCVAGDRVYYVSNRGELVCCDAEGFTDGENDGPIKDEKLARKQDADFLWLLDMRKELGITPHQGSASSPLVVGDLVFVVTGQGRDYTTRKVENPKAPSFIAVEAATGKVVWQDSSPGDRIMSGQWGSPAYGLVEGKPQVAFPGGDGWLYGFEPATGKPLWNFNCKAHEKFKDGKPETTNQLVATPVFVDDRVYISVGEHPDIGGGPPGCLRAIDATKRGDITKDGEVWRLDGANFQQSLCNVAVDNRLVYAVESSGYVNCVDITSGRIIWRHDLLSTVFGSPLVADGKLYIQSGEGDVFVFAAKNVDRLLAKNRLPHLADGTPVAANGVLFLAGGQTGMRLYAIALDK
jgi:outer membrane protein assembly factor BamB